MYTAVVFAVLIGATFAAKYEYEQPKEYKKAAESFQSFHLESHSIPIKVPVFYKEKKYEEPKYEYKHEEPKYEHKYETPKYEYKHEEPKYEYKYEAPKYEYKHEEPKYEPKYKY